MSMIETLPHTSLHASPPHYNIDREYLFLIAVFFTCSCSGRKCKSRLHIHNDFGLRLIRISDNREQVYPLLKDSNGTFKIQVRQVLVGRDQAETCYSHSCIGILL